MKPDHLKQILSEKETKSLPDDFEYNLMLMIRKHVASKSTRKKYIKFMYLFFVLGIGFGIAIAITIVSLDFTLFGRYFSINQSILIIPVIAIILIIFEKIYRISVIDNYEK